MNNVNIENSNNDYISRKALLELVSSLSRYILDDDAKSIGLKYDDVVSAINDVPPAR